MTGSTAARRSAGPYRLSEGGLIDRGSVVSFQFDGDKLTGFAGDTLASALLANGNRVVGRSFKYHRPRGIMTAGPEEPNGLVELGDGARRTPNTKVTGVELQDGLVATSQNRWPSLGFDVLSINSLLAPFLPAGFYYKTFMWPSAFWERVYEPLIRRAAGLGRAASDGDPDSYEQANAFCDLLVVGSGPTGIAAALKGARAGARVILCEDDFCLGGRLLSDRREIDGRPAELWAQDALIELEAAPNVSLMPRTAVFGAYDSGVYGAIERVSDNMPAPTGSFAAPAALAHRCQARGSRGRSDRAKHCFRRQRSPGDSIGVGDAHLRQALCGRARPAHCGFHQQRRWLENRKRAALARDHRCRCHRQPVRCFAVARGWTGESRDSLRRSYRNPWRSWHQVGDRQDS
jgi:hypothetical protein